MIADDIQACVFHSGCIIRSFKLVTIENLPRLAEHECAIVQRPHPTATFVVATLRADLAKKKANNGSRE